MNKEKVIKFHLLFFELISILTLLHGISYLIYYSIIMRFVTTNDFNSMIKASVNFTHNYSENGLFDIQFNISSIEFEELTEAKVKGAIGRNKARKALEYEYVPTNIEDNKSHQGFIILAKKYFNMNYNKLPKENAYAKDNNTKTSVNFNLNSIDSTKNSIYNHYDLNNDTGKNKNFNLVEGNKKLIDPNLAVVRERGIESCFLFLNPNSAVEALNILFETNQLIHDNWNTIIFIVIILFFFFMKINIFFELIKALHKFKFENFPNIFELKNFYVYVIFNGTLFLIIPLLFFGYDDYNFEFCLGFSEAYFNSFLADRQIFLDKQKEYFDPYQRESNELDDENLKFKNNMFFVHDANRNTNNFITRLGYLKNMLFLCIFVWLSGMRNIFNAKKLKTRTIVSEHQEENGMNSCDLGTQDNSEEESQIPKPSRRKKILRYIKNVILIAIFSLYASFGFLNFYDICKLTFLQISNNIKFLFRLQIFFKIFSFLIYFYLYSFTIIVSIYHSYKMYKLKKMKIRDIKYKEIQDNNDSVIITLEKEPILTTNNIQKEKDELRNTDIIEEKLNQEHRNSIYFRRKSDDHLIVDKQENMQISKEDTNDSENNDSYGSMKIEDEHKKESLDSGEIEFKKSHKRITKNFPKKDFTSKTSNRNSSNNKSVESEDKNQNDEEYNKIFSSQSSVEENK